MTTNIFDPSEKYTGPGSTDPSKSRQERETELRKMTASEEGKFIIQRLYHDVKGTHMGVLLRAGTKFGSLIEEILKHEYPNE